jgi:hypothetical protein
MRRPRLGLGLVGLAALLGAGACSLALDTGSLRSACPEGQVWRASKCLVEDGSGLEPAMDAGDEGRADPQDGGLPDAGATDGGPDLDGSTDAGASSDAGASHDGDEPDGSEPDGGEPDGGEDGCQGELGLIPGAAHLVASNAGAPSVAAHDDGFGVVFTRGGEVWFRALDARGTPIEGERGRERLLVPARDDVSPARASLTWGGDSFGLTVAQGKYGMFQRLTRDGERLGTPVDTTPESAFEVGHTRVLRDAPGDWLVFHTGVHSRLVGLRLDAENNVRGQTLADGHVLPPAVVSTSTHVALAWSMITPGDVIIQMQRLHPSLLPDGDAREIARATPPAWVGSPVLATSVSGYALAWHGADPEAGSAFTRFREYDRNDREACGLMLDGDGSDGLFTPRDMIDRLNGYYLLGTATNGGGALQLLDIQVDDATSCRVRASMTLSETDSHTQRAIARSRTRQVVIAWGATGEREVWVRALSPGCVTPRER